MYFDKVNQKNKHRLTIEENKNCVVVTHLSVFCFVVVKSLFTNRFLKSQ